jgi:hypothetical protein
LMVEGAVEGFGGKIWVLRVTGLMGWGWDLGFEYKDVTFRLQA